MILGLFQIHFSQIANESSNDIITVYYPELKRESMYRAKPHCLVMEFCVLQNKSLSNVNYALWLSVLDKRGCFLMTLD